MRRPFTIAAFLVLAFLPVSAQRGGMRVSGSGRGVDVGHPSGGSGMRGGVGAGPRMHPTPSFRGEGFGGGRIRARGFHHCFGCRRSFGFPFFAGYYPPYWWWDSSSLYNYDEDQARELALANEMNSVSLEEQRLRQQEERDQDLYARRPQPREEERAAVMPATALVFRDQHVEEIRNYAIAGGTLWVLNDHQTGKKIPLTQLDLPATVKMNDDRGVDFQVPGPTLQLMILH